MNEVWRIPGYAVRSNWLARFTLIRCAASHHVRCVRISLTVPFCWQAFTITTGIMDSLPPNDPNRSNPPAGGSALSAKEAPYDGRSSPRRNPAEPMDAIGDMQDSPMVVAMFLVGVVTWFLRERCVC
jgi:hypothetical protein